MRQHPEAILLTNGRFASLVSDGGGGGAIFGNLAVTRWIPDSTLDAYGQWLLIRNLDTGRYWSASPLPISHSDVCHEVQFRPGVAELSAVAGDIEVRTSVCVSPDVDVELRRYAIANHGKSDARLELTSYAELVLNTPAGDAGHPAFSKLFVQTRFDASRQALVASRRLRNPYDDPLVIAQTLVGCPSRHQASHETDRMRFIGRGRTLAAPRAMDAPGDLSCTVGNVLDPVFALRRTLELSPGETTHVVSVLAAAPDETVLELASSYTLVDAVDRTFSAAAKRAERSLNEAGLTRDWDRVPSAIGALAYGGRPLAALADEEDLYRLVVAELPETKGKRGRGMTSPPSIGAKVTAEAHRASVVTGRQERRIATRQATDGKDAPAAGEADGLIGFNGYGGFSSTRDEYVIRMARDDSSVRVPPLPWSNVIANEDVGFIVSETGAGYTWSVNSRENRLTPWYNDPVCDPHGEALWLRDEETGVFWSPVPGPTPGDGDYEARHGFGYSRWKHESNGLVQKTWMFVPRREPVKIVCIQLTNTTATPRRLALYSYAQLVLGDVPQKSGHEVVTEVDAATGALFARKPWIDEFGGDFAGRTLFAAVYASVEADISHTGDRAAFLGVRGSLAEPQSVASGGRLDGRTGDALDPCAAFRASFVIPPRANVECYVLLGEASSDDAARAFVSQYEESGVVTWALKDVREFWRELVSAVQIETPSMALDVMVNGWLTYQNLSCRMWGRSAYYQSGGAFGFRDQLQDSAALLYLDPGITRRQILLHAAHQFVEGDVLHWWHPPRSKGIRTRFSDDLLWLPYVAAFYARTTGDDAVFDEPVRYVSARELEQGEDEAFLYPNEAAAVGSVYEHCCRAIDRSLTRGAHGLPLMGVGDWNDGMNRVGREGRGESVWLGFFLHDILRDFIPRCERRGDHERARTYAAYQTQLRHALNSDDGGWDGEWYRRAYYDNGAPLGSKSSDECKIDAIAQAWSVLSKAAPEERAGRALDAMEKHLVSEREGIIRLLTPAFDKTPNDPGYIKGYLPGVRENGGQYTHGALWAVRALATIGRTDRAAKLLEMLSPVSRGSTRDGVDRYMAEPYVIAADVYGVAPHVGRAGWTWYTGSAGWMYRVALESILGLELEGGRVVRLRPCIPTEWPGFTLRYARHEFRVRRAPAGQGTSFGEGTDVAPRVEHGAIVIDLVNDGRTHIVEIALGADVGPKYVGADNA